MWRILILQQYVYYYLCHSTAHNVQKIAMLIRIVCRLPDCFAVKHELPWSFQQKNHWTTDWWVKSQLGSYGDQLLVRAHIPITMDQLLRTRVSTSNTPLSLPFQLTINIDYSNYYVLHSFRLRSNLACFVMFTFMSINKRY